ncbi:unnamed protein product [Linum trigynum]|uniref:Uncharacterized protein n=1 Tax=Linum trigynum TaxID=586398 RepID=A0AAV2DNM2_9ROSI
MAVTQTRERSSAVAGANESTSINKCCVDVGLLGTQLRGGHGHESHDGGGVAHPWDGIGAMEHGKEELADAIEGKVAHDLARGGVMTPEEHDREHISELTTRREMTTQGPVSFGLRSATRLSSGPVTVKASLELG